MKKNEDSDEQEDYMPAKKRRTESDANPLYFDTHCNIITDVRDPSMRDWKAGSIEKWVKHVKPLAFVADIQTGDRPANQKAKIKACVRQNREGRVFALQLEATERDLLEATKKLNKYRGINIISRKIVSGHTVNWINNIGMRQSESEGYDNDEELLNEAIVAKLSRTASKKKSEVIDRRVDIMIANLALEEDPGWPHNDEMQDARCQVHYYDDITGEELDPMKVNEARREEMRQIYKHGVYKKVRREVALAHNVGKPITLRWIDINKGSKELPDYRSRIVARDLRGKDEESIFAATPPWEAKQLLFSLAASQLGREQAPLKLGFIDIKRAYFHADCKIPTFIELPEEDSTEEERRHMCGQLLKSLYGTKTAAVNWEDKYADCFSSVGTNVG